MAGSVARVVDRNQKLFLAARPPKAQVAIVYNPLAHFVGGRQRATAYAGPQGEVAGIERDSLLGIYRALFPRNVPIDYIHIDRLSQDVLRQYKIVFVPYPVMLPERSAVEFAEYVKAGGALVAEARFGWNNERGRASERIPGMGLWEVMGCRETDVQTGAKGRTTLRWLATGDTLPARWYEETLEPASHDARVVAQFSDGRPAGITSSYGKGKTLMLGSFISAAYETAPAPEVERFYQGLLEWAGVELPVVVESGGVEVRYLESGPTTLVFAFNHTKQPVAAAFSLKGHRLEHPIAAQDVWFTTLEAH
jgi:beta-galactosidase